MAKNVKQLPVRSNGAEDAAKALAKAQAELNATQAATKDKAQRDADHAAFISALDGAGEGKIVLGGWIATLARLLPAEIDGLSEEAFKEAKRAWRARVIHAGVNKYIAVRAAQEGREASPNALWTMDAVNAELDKSEKVWSAEFKAHNNNAKSILSQAFKAAAIEMKTGLPKPAATGDNAGGNHTGNQSADKAAKDEAKKRETLDAVIATMQPDDLVKALKKLSPIVFASVMTGAAGEYLASNGQCAHVAGGLDSEAMDALQDLMADAIRLGNYYRAKAAKDVTPKAEETKAA